MSSDFNWRRAVALAAILALATVGVASAQRGGNIYGTVSDDSGSKLPGVTVHCEGMGAPRQTVTDDGGAYRFLGLDPGTFYVKAELDGFSTVEQPNVVVALNRNTTINFTLSSAVEDVITVTSESPLLDERKLSQGANISQVELEKIPSGRDPWSIMNQAPGVLVDRINVGGNESGQQSVFRGQGVSSAENDFQVDGVQITDMAAIGASPTYYDFEQFEAIELGTGGADVTKNAAGVSVNMVTRRGTNEFRGTARFLSAKGNGLGFFSQSSSDFNCADLGANQNCDTFGLKSINSITEYGFEAGGPAVTDRLWFWGSYGVSDIQQFNAGGGADNTILENTAIKVNGQLNSSNSALATWNNGDKKKFGRGAGPSRAQETTWDQRGPSAIMKVEDTHVFNSNFYLTGQFNKVDLGFALATKGTLAGNGLDTEWGPDGVWRNNYLGGFSRRPGQEIKLDGSYFFNTGDMSHELKFGARNREVETASDFAWGGSGLVHISDEVFGTPRPVILIRRNVPLQTFEQSYNSAWIQDTMSSGNWTVNAGFRYDAQDGTIGGASSVTPPAPFNAFFPQLSAGGKDPGFDWADITPRLGATYALGEDRDTLLRASFSMFPEALSTGDISQTNGVSSYAYGYWFFDDTDGDNFWDPTESYDFWFASGWNPDDPTNSATVNTVDSGLKPDMTTEIIFGVEHSFLPEFVVGATFTWRNIDDISSAHQLIRGPGITDPMGRAWTAADFVPSVPITQVLPTVIADGSTRTINTWELGSAFSRTGGTALGNDSRSREYQGLGLTFNKRLSNRWGARGFINFGETEWDVPASYSANSDPNDGQDGSDNDGAIFFERSSGSGRGDIYLQSSWQANLTGIYQVAPDRPWGFTLSGNVYAREGYPVPYDVRRSVGNQVFARNMSLLGRNVDQFRTDDVMTTDLRVEKEFSATSNVSLTFGLDYFNALNEATVTAREPTLSGGSADNVQDLIAPRVWKLGVRVSWR